MNNIDILGNSNGVVCSGNKLSSISTNTTSSTSVIVSNNNDVAISGFGGADVLADNYT